MRRVVSQGLRPEACRDLERAWGSRIWGLGIGHQVPGLGIVARLGYTLNPKPYTLLNLWDSRVLNPPIALRGSMAFGAGRSRGLGVLGFRFWLR